MSNYVDLKYINILSSRLQMFKRKNDYLFNFRCPYCGDSQKDKTKARGYLYRVKTNMFYKCHNCGVGTNLAGLIKKLDTKLYSEYTVERYRKTDTKKEKVEFDFKPFKNENTDIINGLKKIAELDLEHPARVYCENRKLTGHLNKLYFAPKFMTFCNKAKPKTYVDITRDYPRLIIPFYNEHGEFFAFQGRAFGKEQPKYVTIKLDEEQLKIYGLDRIVYDDDIRIVEGPLDSLFVKNCVAAAGADLREINNNLLKDPQQMIYIYDNEPRNNEIIKRMYKAIDDGHKIVIWPDDLKEKDINDMVISGLDVEEIIYNNTYHGLSAIAKLDFWKRV